MKCRRMATLILGPIAIACFVSTAFAVKPQVSKVEPPNWWRGMRMNKVQLMIYGENLTGVTARSNSPFVKVLRVLPIDNPDYAFVDLDISSKTPPGTYRLTLTTQGGSVDISYPVRKRPGSRNRYRGFDQRDVIYLITPDRFADGDTTNNSVEGFREGTNRENPVGRHGGDIQGIIDHLDYLRDLGVSAVWINPLLENNNEYASYHGYAATDLYRIDPRFGTNPLYERMVATAHKKGLKVILDHVNNHISIRHPWITDLPMPDWINGTVLNHQKTSHDKPSLNDIHTDSTVKQITTRGWFSESMPDLNQNNPFVSQYLIQNTIWWIESTGIDGIREDTYPYCEQRYLSTWARAVLDEYPHFNIVGEVWVGDPAFLAPYQKGSPLPKAFDTNLPSITDFAMMDAFVQVFGAQASIKVIHDCLAKDFLYADPTLLVTFVDNHDVRRIMYVTEGNVKRAKLALAILLTVRGIPELYYGTEIGMMGGKDHGTIRGEFRGGFPGDQNSAFSVDGRTTQENDMFTYLRQLLHIRKTHPILASGEFIHYPPVNEGYTYLRTNGRETYLVVVNNKAEQQTVSLENVRPHLGKAKALKSLLNGSITRLTDKPAIEVEGWTAGIYQTVE